MPGDAGAVARLKPLGRVAMVDGEELAAGLQGRLDLMCFVENDGAHEPGARRVFAQLAGTGRKQPGTCSRVCRR